MQTHSVAQGGLVLREDRYGVAILRLNRPQQLNALSADLIEALDAELQTLEAAPDIHGIVLTGAGDKAFCAGADISAMADMTPQQALEWGRRGQRVANRLQNHPKPIVAAVNGYALGGGLELAMACDWIIAVPGTKVGQPEVGIGVIPGFAGTQRLARLVGAHAAKWLCMTGDKISSEEAHRLGLVTHLVAKEQIVDYCVQMLAKLKDNAPIAVRLCKDAINRGVNMDLEAAMQLELEAFALTFATKDQKEGMRAFVEKRKPHYTGQ
jgi:enoyl-CoA hydratase